MISVFQHAVGSRNIKGQIRRKMKQFSKLRCELAKYCNIKVEKLKEMTSVDYLSKSIQTL